MSPLTVAICSYNRAERLPGLIAALRVQECPIPFEILVVNNNSTDNTLDVLGDLASQPGAPLRFATETEQGIVPARNRAIEESLNSDILVFIDDDELPQAGLLNAAYDAIVNEGAQCAGGRVAVDFTAHSRPAWLDDEIAGFLGELDHGPEPFWIKDGSTPVWSGNIAYDMRLFRDNPSLRFDRRYNREGADVGGGEDAIMFRTLLSRGTKIRYRPDMVVRHYVESRRLKRSYFLALHYRSGLRHGRHELETYSRTVLGVPPFLVAQCLRQGLRATGMLLTSRPGALRQAMNAANSLGRLVGYAQRPKAY
ncbi:MAG: glycosyltransferase [Gammaproteobacteria bacterium]|nr:glycosyltransferase [Gammaproteobacteria bacterium]